MSTALQSRMVHLTLTVSKDEWVKWAIENNIDTRVISFIEFRQDLLHSFDPNHQHDTFPCPRTWEFVSRIVEDDESIPVSLLPLLVGTVSSGPATEFRTFCDIWQELPRLEDIARSPETAIISKSAQTNYATVGMLASSVELTTIGSICKYVRRMPNEFQLVFVRMAFKYNRTLIQNATFQQMLKDFRQDLKEED